MIKVKHRGNFKAVETFLKRMKNKDFTELLKRYGQKGVDVLSSATPVRTGLTAASWSYEIEHGAGVSKIIWTNSNIVDGVPIVLILQYGHGTKNGGYVQGRDFINPAIRPVLDEIAKSAWEEVIRS